MLPLVAELQNLPEFSELLHAVELGKTPAAAGGLSPVHRAHFAAGLRHFTGRPLIVLCPDDLSAARTAKDLSAFLGAEAALLPARELVFYRAETVSREWERKRIAVLSAMLTGDAPVVVTSLEAALLRTMPPRVLTRASFTVSVGERISPDALLDALLRAGYRRSLRVEGEGQFAFRGGILDCFSAAHPSPARIEFFDDEVDTVSLFSVETQRRTESIDCARVLPTAETLPTQAPRGIDGLIHAISALKSTEKHVSPALSGTLDEDIHRLENGISFAAADRYMHLIYPEFKTALDYLPTDALLVIFDTARLSERAKTLAWQSSEDLKALLENGTLHPSAETFYLPPDRFYDTAQDAFPLVFLDSFIGAKTPVSPRSIFSVVAKQLPSFRDSLDTAVSDVAHYVENGYKTLVLCHGEAKARHLSENLAGRGVNAPFTDTLAALPAPGLALTLPGGFSAGFEYPSIPLAVVAEGEPLPKRAERVRKKSSRERVRSYADLKPGDAVVHEHHGVALFEGIVTMPVDGVERDYVKLRFLGADSLYVPATQLDLVSKYIGAGEEGHVRLSKLGGAEWKSAKSRAKGAAKEMAKELIRLYAERQRRPGYQFPPDNDWQREFEDAFEYDETEDQLRCALEIKGDMERPVPMDRLLCGDVGFGKTEVALRAAMKCMLSGKQAAILVPTTILALQHYNTAVGRFSGYPVNIDMMCRFRTAKQMKETAEKLRDGRVDLIIGTHRILQKDISFKDLGLLIVDEEQRFGVTHKELLKELSRSVDVLTLTATPIPRTLNMALSNIRDMSALEEAPRDRHPVQTYVLEHDQGVLFDAIRREVARGGQVYYLHNRVETISRAVSRLTREFPDLRIASAHGKMSEDELGEVMRRMSEGEVDVLVCTTIIETGIDIPNVNTLIVEDSDRLGLSQLHQIRGRVGRSRRHAFAYLTYRKGKILTEIAEKRLSAVREFAEFGAGFKIAMRDLEIRGAGNILGHSQSGHMMSVGYDMYLKLLEEAVLEERGESPLSARECTADISVSASIPEKFIPSPEERMDFYRRIALLRTEEDASDLIDELCDRYGDLPRPVHALIRIALLRAAARELNITDISQKSGHLTLKVLTPDVRAVLSLCSERRYKGRLFFNAGSEPYLSLRLKKEEEILSTAEGLIAALSEQATMEG